jgi:hypothetical protein
MPGEDGPGQVVKVPRTGPTVRALAMGLSLVLTVLDDGVGVAMRTDDPIGPTEVTDGLEALGVVDEVGERDHEARREQQGMKTGHEPSQRHIELKL